MKTTLLKLISVTLAAILPLLTSCKKEDTVSSLSDELVLTVDELSVTIESVTDKSSAEKAAEKIETIGDDFLSVVKRFEELGELSDEDKELVGTKMLQAMRVMNDKRMDSLEKNDVETSIILGKAIEGFGSKTKSVEDQFRRHSR
ncbi:MAG: hypothetical protein ACSHX9_10130 [Luteolibacter sp.]